VYIVHIQGLKLSSHYHHGNLREALLAAAMNALCKGDGPEVSLRSLSTEVGVTVNAAYRHFPDKNALLLELASLGFDDLKAKLEDSLKTLKNKSPKYKLYAVGVTYIDFALEFPSLFRLMFDRRGSFNGNERFHQASSSSFEVLVHCMAEVRKEPANSPEVMKASLAAWALVHGYAVLALEGYIGALPIDRRLKIEEVVRMINPRGLA
jgi:AcrR family transcriptional regulator